MLENTLYLNYSCSLLYGLNYCNTNRAILHNFITGNIGLSLCHVYFFSLSTMTDNIGNSCRLETDTKFYKALDAKSAGWHHRCRAQPLSCVAGSLTFCQLPESSFAGGTPAREGAWAALPLFRQAASQLCEGSLPPLTPHCWTGMPPVREDGGSTVTKVSGPPVQGGG